MGATAWTNFLLSDFNLILDLFFLIDVFFDEGLVHVRCDMSLSSFLCFLLLDVKTLGQIYFTLRCVLSPLDRAVLLGVVSHLLNAVHFEDFCHVLVSLGPCTGCGLIGPAADRKSTVF